MTFFFGTEGVVAVRKNKKKEEEIGVEYVSIYRGSKSQAKVSSAVHMHSTEI
jgi:hypothetical protein